MYGCKLLIYFRLVINELLLHCSDLSMDSNDGLTSDVINGNKSNWWDWGMEM